MRFPLVLIAAAACAVAPPDPSGRRCERTSSDAVIRVVLSVVPSIDTQTTEPDIEALVAAVNN